MPIDLRPCRQLQILLRETDSRRRNFCQSSSLKVLVLLVATDALGKSFVCVGLRSYDQCCEQICEFSPLRF